MNLPLFIAKRINSPQASASSQVNHTGGQEQGGSSTGGQGLSSPEERPVSRPAITIATLGVAIGLAVMILSVAVVTGFKHSIRDKVTGFSSHITVGEIVAIQTDDPHPIQINDSITNLLRDIPGVKHVQPFAFAQGILKTDSDFLAVRFKGINEQYDTTFLHQNILTGSITPLLPRKEGSEGASGSQGAPSLIISQLIANQLNIKCGDRIYAYFISNQGVRTRRFNIAGIYQTNLTQFDRAITFTDLHTAQKLNGWKPDQVSGAEITVDDYENIDNVEDIIIGRINRTTDQYGETYSSITTQEANPQIFSWLQLLDLNVWIILALMVALAAFTMTSGLLIIILERTSMIGTLKALGATNRTVRRTFLWLAAFIIGRALVFGNIIAIALILLQKYTGIIRLDPETYYVATVPIELNITHIIIINVATLIITLTALILPAHLVVYIQPAKAMRYE